jgi:glycosyltransferase involved in cell wall biosynthesis
LIALGVIPSVEILIGPEGPERLQAIATGLAPRLDYRLVADCCQASIQQWGPPPSGLRGPELTRLSRSLLGNFGHALRLTHSLAPGSIVYSTGETWGLPMAVAGALIPRRRFTHVVYVHRVFSPTWLRFLRAVRNRLAVDGWICVTHYQAGLLRRALGVGGKPVAVVSQGVDTAFFDPGKATPAQGRPYLLAVGAEMRNYDLLFEAARDLDVEVVVKASSAWMAAGRSETAAVPANIKLVSQRQSYNELRDLYAGAALVVAPLYDTPQAAGITSILEGMAMGKCIIATQSSGLPDALIDGETGLITPPTAKDLRMAIASLLDSPDSRALLARAGQQLVQARFKLEDHATAVAAFLSASARE